MSVNDNGSGDGSGYGEKPSVVVKAREQIAGRFDSEPRTLALWRSQKDGTPANGGRSAPVKPGLIQREPGPLRDECGAGQLHATLKPEEWQGDRIWIVALGGEVRGDAEKMWALEREIIEEVIL